MFLVFFSIKYSLLLTRACGMVKGAHICNPEIISHFTNKIQWSSVGSYISIWRIKKMGFGFGTNCKIFSVVRQARFPGDGCSSNTFLHRIVLTERWKWCFRERTCGSLCLKPVQVTLQLMNYTYLITLHKAVILLCLPSSSLKVGLLQSCFSHPYFRSKTTLLFFLCLCMLQHL